MKKEKAWPTREVATRFGQWMSQDVGKPNSYGYYGKMGSGYEMTIDRLYEVFLMNNGIDPDQTIETPSRSLPKRLLLGC